MHLHTKILLREIFALWPNHQESFPSIELNKSPKHHSPTSSNVLPMNTHAHFSTDFSCTALHLPSHKKTMINRRKLRDESLMS
ncbi:hypothetical protein BpHYR1_027873 [Brachionus plicatilis]|uniref:Uncharacterized protein n=1 Tax=Brachionus plicatilis TaxID=10195 RepID=A0A3M7P5W3_BRAPC|nr:hypothetical protein BpHYR1_027873 [Brachionus plicatilis]